MPTFAQLRERFPNASLGFLAANASDGLPPELCPRKPEVAPVQVKVATPAKTQRKRISRVPRTRNGNTITEAAYWGKLRSALRRTFRFWTPAIAALKAAKTPCRGPNGQRFAYLCAKCQKLHPKKCVQIDHVVPVGRLLSFDDLPGFVARLTPEDPAAFQILCQACHDAKTLAERATASGDGSRQPEAPATLELL